MTRGVSCSRGCSEPQQSAREAPRRDRFWQPERPSQFPPYCRDYPATLTQDSEPKRFRRCQIRSPGPLGLIPAALSIPWSRKTRRVTQTLTREPVFTRCCDIFTEQPPGVCGRSIEVIYRANHRLFGTFGADSSCPWHPQEQVRDHRCKGFYTHAVQPHVFTPTRCPRGCIRSLEVFYRATS